MGESSCPNRRVRDRWAAISFRSTWVLSCVRMHVFFSHCLSHLQLCCMGWLFPFCLLVTVDTTTTSVPGLFLIFPISFPSLSSPFSAWSRLRLTPQFVLSIYFSRHFSSTAYDSVLFTLGTSSLRCGCWVWLGHDIPRGLVNVRLSTKSTNQFIHQSLLPPPLCCPNPCFFSTDLVVVLPETQGLRTALCRRTRPAHRH